jgi:DNA-binding transcriptional ArsR family regulator
VRAEIRYGEDMAKKTDSAQQVSDPRVLRAIAHPLRNRILGELLAAGHLRAADVAEILEIPANQASFHLRQLAKYGLVEPAPELARDGRDRVWKAVNDRGVTLEVNRMEEGPGGKAAVAVWQRQAAARSKEAVDRAYASRGYETHTMISDAYLRLTLEEAREFSAELLALQDKWQGRSQQESGTAEAARSSYHLMVFVQPAPAVEA